MLHTKLVASWELTHFVQQSHRETAFKGNMAYKKKNKNKQGFPGGSVVKMLPANAGDVGMIRGPERSHMPWGN